MCGCADNALGMVGGGRGDLRSEEWRGQETTPQQQEFYNQKRKHQTLDRQTPNNVY